MRGTHVSYSDAWGGADIAASRLHLDLLEAGVDSRMARLHSYGRTPKAKGLCRKTSRIGARLASRLRFEQRSIQCDSTYEGMSVNSRRNAIPARLRALHSDIVHLHWVGGGTEHVGYESVRWRDGYTRENRSRQSRGFDLNRRGWDRKWQAWRRKTIHTISVSVWMGACAWESRLIRERSGERVIDRKGIDLGMFRLATGAMGSGRSVSGRSRPVRLLCGAVSEFLPVNGADAVQAVLDALDQQDGRFELIAFGCDAPQWLRQRGVHVSGYIDAPEELAELYREADLFVIPSRLESSGQTAAEAMDCGVSIVCFDTTGLLDVFYHGENGYKARPYDTGDVAERDFWAVGDDSRYRRICENVREKALHSFSLWEAAEQTCAFCQFLREGIPTHLTRSVR